ncbi:sensor histidine kinase [Oceanicola granulosus HTCC2516]|uniref:histidine kinase n=1 Tax=Oceanicola granulosus (strain ATCC BAA-861 / DSM 15982 / KCTC 12143 / HTCC2516) TaxID=314256 RepID=Q2CK21_OCEGH|nr:histidine kinase dimerization/phosphoacceptor domain -containing protein [Oceanicola granulosus]EAR52968.1 sensor histidine kinase [Oceanicola granulosus HTCC2516]
MLAPPHPDDAQRLQELASYDILDTGREADFDAIVSLAARICDVPVALISFVDSDRQWFKARVGFDRPETGLEESICSHALHQPDILEITDTRDDPRTVDNPLCVADDSMRFYAGAPMITAAGVTLGTLCVLDRRPRELTELQRDTLTVLSRQVVHLLEGRRNLRYAEMQRKEIDHRVKNSLQSIASYARLLSSDTDSEEARYVLSVLRGRIETVAALHEALYKTSASSEIDLGAYLRTVADLLGESCPENVAIHIEAPEAYVQSPTATACAVIMNEVVANAIKHAFPDGRDGEIRIEASRTDTCYRLNLADNGVGIDGKSSAGLGLRIIDAAVAQIGGKVEVLPQDGPGHAIRVSLPLD